MPSRIDTWNRRLRFAAVADVVRKRPSSGANIDVLDGVRGLAVLMVLASHTGLLHLETHGAVGVWLFFCLSAFLLTMPYARRPERVAQPAQLRHYVSRRLRRILPAYYLVITISFFYGREADFAYLARHLLFLRADGILWTIPQEMLFYLLLPPLAALHPYLVRGSLPGAALVLALVATLANLYLDASVFALNGNGRWLPFHLGIFATGMAFCYAYHWPPLAALCARPAVNRALDAFGLLLLLLLFATARHYHESYLADVPGLGSLRAPMGWNYPGTYGVACSALIFVALVCPGGWLHRLLSSFPLRALGIVSFSFYLLHVVVRDKFLSFGYPMGAPLFLATLAVTYALSCAVYGLVERPFMRIRTRPESAPGHAPAEPGPGRDPAGTRGAR